MHDAKQQTDSPSEYECLQCGKLVTADSHPGDCPNCGGVMQNRAMSLE